MPSTPRDVPPAGPQGDVDLPPELRGEIDRLDARLGAASHHEVLGVPRGCTAEAARAAYVDLVRRFHPDRFGGRRLGPYRERLERIARRLTEARDVLGDDRRREEYEERTATPAEVARRELRRLEDEARAEERRGRLARRNPLVARAARVAELVERAQGHADAGKHASALADAMTVLALDPRNARAQAIADAARRAVAIERSHELYEDGLRHEAAGRDEIALERFSSAAELTPDDPRPAVAAARAALRLGRVDEGQRLARAAVRAGPRHAPAHVALGAALAARGEKGDARKALERALELDPAAPEAKALLRTLRWSPFR